MRPAARIYGVIGAAVLALVSTACGGGAGGAYAPAGVVRASWGDPQNPLEPANTNEVQGGKVLGMIFRGLKHYNPRTGEAENMVAQSIQTSDSKNFTIKIKPGWKFSNGERVTAASFITAWNYAALATNEQRGAYFLQYIDGYNRVHPESGRPTATNLSGLRQIDDRTFTVKLRQKYATWPDTLGYASYYPLPRAFFTHHQAWLNKPVGNGPYKVESYTPGQTMKLRRNASYAGPDKPRNRGVDLQVYTDNNTAYTDLMAGNLDIADDIPATQLRNVRADLAGRYVNTSAGVIQTLSFPMYEARWSGKRAQAVRRALSMAIDRAQITKTLFHGTRVPATDWTSPVLGAQGGYRPGLCGDACDYNPAKARKLIAGAGGIPGGKFTITYNADTGSHRDWIDAICNSINNALRNDHACVGSPVGTFADFRGRLAGKRMSGPFRAGWQMDYPLIQNFLQPLYYTNGSSNDSHWSNKRFDALTDQANAEPAAARSIALFQDAEKILAQEMPAIPLWYQNGDAGYSSRVSGVALDQFSVPIYADVKVSG